MTPPKVPSSAQVGPTLPTETRSGGGLNDTLTPAQRNPETPTDLQDGPRIDPKNGVYLPATYKTSRGNIRIDR